MWQRSGGNSSLFAVPLSEQGRAVPRGARCPRWRSYVQDRQARLRWRAHPGLFATTASWKPFAEYVLVLCRPHVGHKLTKGLHSSALASDKSTHSHSLQLTWNIGDVGKNTCSMYPNPLSFIYMANYSPDRRTPLVISPYIG